MQTTIKNEKSKYWFVFMLSITLLLSVVILIINIFRWSLVEILTPFLEPILELFVYGCFIIFMLISLLYLLFTKSRRNRKRNAIPLGIMILVFGIVVFVPFTRMTIELDYYAHNSEREEVIKLIEEGKITKSKDQFVTLLPKKYRNLSKGGGEIVITGSDVHKEVLFYTFRGVIDNFSGFIYTSNGSYPDETLYGSRFVEVKKYKEHWFWVSAT